MKEHCFEFNVCFAAAGRFIILRCYFALLRSVDGSQYRSRMAKGVFKYCTLASYNIPTQYMSAPGIGPVFVVFVGSTSARGLGVAFRVIRAEGGGPRR